MHAEWPEDKSLDGSGSCRTFQAIYCKKKKRHVHKNMPCPEKSKPKTIKAAGSDGTHD
jgi:hypothetical protein